MYDDLWDITVSVPTKNQKVVDSIATETEGSIVTDSIVTDSIVTEIDSIVTDSIVTEIDSIVTDSIATEADSIDAPKIKKTNKVIKGFTLRIYNYIKNNEGKDTNTVSQCIDKKTDFIRPYLHRMIKYGLIVKENDKWYLAKEN